MPTQLGNALTYMWDQFQFYSLVQNCDAANSYLTLGIFFEAPDLVWNWATMPADWALPNDGDGIVDFRSQGNAQNFVVDNPRYAIEYQDDAGNLADSHIGNTRGRATWRQTSIALDTRFGVKRKPGIVPY